MTIVLNEREWTEDMLTQRSLGNRPFETLCRVARYYLDNGMAKRDVRKLMDNFLLKCDPMASLPKWADALDRALAKATKYKSINIEYMSVTKPEMERVLSIGGKQAQRLAFTLLCLAKYWNVVSDTNDGWVNSKDSDIMRMANINTSIKRQSLMYYNLNAAGLIRFSRKVDNTNVQVCFMEEGEEALRVTDFRNLGLQLLKYCGGPYFVCENCGLTTKYSDPVKGKKQKYCKECAAQIAVQQRVNSVMRQYARKDKTA